MKRADSICFDGAENLTVSLRLFEHAHLIKELVEQLKVRRTIITELAVVIPELPQARLQNKQSFWLFFFL